MATHSSILSWEIPWTEEAGRLQSMGSQKSQTQLSEHTFTRKAHYSVFSSFLIHCPKLVRNHFGLPESISQKIMAPHTSTLAWKIPWTEEPGRLQSMGSLRVGHD